MEISDIRIGLSDNTGIQKAVASFVIDGCFAVHGVRILQGENGLFIAMPARRTTDGKYKDVAHPIDSDTRIKISDAVLDAYEEKRKDNDAAISR